MPLLARNRQLPQRSDPSATLWSAIASAFPIELIRYHGFGSFTKPPHMRPNASAELPAAYADQVGEFPEKTPCNSVRALARFGNANPLESQNFGEPGWDRTNDHLIKSQMLYR